MNPPRADPRPVLHETLPLDLPDTSAPLHRQETLMSFAYVLSTLRRRWLVVLLTMLLGALGGACYAELTPDRYDATTSLVVSPVISNPLTGSREDVNIRTEQEILGSREVAPPTLSTSPAPAKGCAARSPWRPRWGLRSFR